MTAAPISGIPGAPPIPSLNGGDAGPALSETFFSDAGYFGQSFGQEGDVFRSDFVVGGSGLFSGAGQAAFPWQWLILAGAALAGLWVWKR